MNNPKDKQYIYPDGDKEVERIIRQVKAADAPKPAASMSVDEVLKETLAGKKPDNAAPAGRGTSVPAAKPASPRPVSVKSAQPAISPMVLTAGGAAATPVTKSKKEPWYARLYHSLIPQRGDGAVEMLRKFLFMLAFLTLISSAVYIVYDTIWIPAQNAKLAGEINDIYQKAKDGSEEERRKMMEELYAKNDDFRAFLTYEATTDEDFLQINYPVMYSGDNSYYLEHDFYKEYNKNGALFFDWRNNYTRTSAQNKVSIIYGHNMNSGQMFAHLNLFLENVARAKAAPLIRMDTLFGTEQYKVFAVVVTNTKESDGPVFDYLRVSFDDDMDFLNYVNEYRARSLYNYDSVSVEADDELLVLSTCTTKGGVSFEDGRLAVIARKVRVGESTAVDTTQITDNPNVIMPLAWYKNQGLSVHPYYDGGYTIPTATTTTTADPEDVGDTTTMNTKDDFYTPETTTTTAQEVVMTGDGRTTTGKVTVGSYTNKPTTTTKAPPKTTTKAPPKPTTTKPATTTTPKEPEATNTPDANGASANSEPAA